jgi:hypothetical protein
MLVTEGPAGGALRRGVPRRDWGGLHFQNVAQF